MPLYEVAIVETPTPKQAEEGAVEKLVLGPEPIIARDPQSAAMRVAMAKKDSLANVDPERMNVIVRPFA